MQKQDNTRGLNYKSLKGANQVSAFFYGLAIPLVLYKTKQSVLRRNPFPEASEISVCFEQELSEGVSMLRNSSLF